MSVQILSGFSPQREVLQRLIRSRRLDNGLKYVIESFCGIVFPVTPKKEWVSKHAQLSSSLKRSSFVFSHMVKCVDRSTVLNLHTGRRGAVWHSWQWQDTSAPFVSSKEIIVFLQEAQFTLFENREVLDGSAWFVSERDHSWTHVSVRGPHKAC